MKNTMIVAPYFLLSVLKEYSKSVTLLLVAFVTLLTINQKGGAMAIVTKDIKCTGIFKLSYDPESADFKAALKSYQQSIEKGGTINSMLKHVVHHLNKYGGYQRLIEGVGFVRVQS